MKNVVESLNVSHHSCPPKHVDMSPLTLTQLARASLSGRAIFIAVALVILHAAGSLIPRTAHAEVRSGPGAVQGRSRRDGLLTRSRLFGVLCIWGGVLLQKVGFVMLAKPVRKLGQLFPKAADRLLVHVCLRNKLREGHCASRKVNPSRSSVGQKLNLPSSRARCSAPYVVLGPSSADHPFDTSAYCKRSKLIKMLLKPTMLYEIGGLGVAYR